MYAGDFGDSFPDNTQVPNYPVSMAWMNPDLFNNVFCPQYLYKNKPGTSASGKRSQNDVLFCPADGWHRAYEAQQGDQSDRIQRLALSHYGPLLAGLYNSLGFGAWFARSKFGGRYRNAPVMTDDIEKENGGWVRTIATVETVSSSAHVNRNNIPAGGNFLFEDAHVEWIKFDYPTFKIIGPVAPFLDRDETMFGIFILVKNGKGPCSDLASKIKYHLAEKAARFHVGYY